LGDASDYIDALQRGTGSTMALLNKLIAYYRRKPMHSVYHHGALYVGVALVLFGLRYQANIYVPIFWPLLAWFFIAAIHFFIVKSMEVDDEWADAKADKLRRDAYDFQHVREIYNEPKTLERIAAEKRKRKDAAAEDDSE
jgi:uncharacterized membrane protein